jgi:catechol 2,3-dioxygenase-like lactoylglutathione lyase family enzyme
MLGAQPIAAFVATTQPDVAQRFYAETLGLRLTSRDQYALVFDAGGTMLRVVIVETFQPQPFTVLGWSVPDIHASVTDLTARGVTFRRYAWMDQDALGVWTAPDGAKVAWFTDPDGNTLSLTESGT